MTRPRVAIVQEYVPQYRVKFFAGLVAELRDRGLDCSVIAGQPSGAQALRGDAVEQMDWLVNAEARRVNVGSRTIRFYGTDQYWRDCDGLIMELRGTSIDLTRELLMKRRTRRRVGVWGHIKSFTQPGHPLDIRIERFQMKRSDHVFAYTKSGSEFAINSGVEPSDVTTVVNSIDVAELINQYDSIDGSEVSEFQRLHRLTPGKTFGYIGGLDASKRIDFLANAMEVIYRRDPEVKLLVAGRGDQEELLTPLVQRGQVVRLGYADAKLKALIARVSQGLVNPGRVGLLAVECMAVKLPILTTDWPFHAPEFEYLEPGVDVLSSPDGVNQFADLVLRSVGSDQILAATEDDDYPSIDQMIGNFAAGITAMMA